MSYLLFFFALLFFSLRLSAADQTVYLDTDWDPQGNIELFHKPTAILSIRTSNAYLSNTIDGIFATLIGTFSHSGPHDISSFLPGSERKIVLPLDRKIGELNQIILSNNGNDGWLPTTITCKINNVVFELRGPRMWVDSLDPVGKVSTGNGYEPQSQEGEESLPAGPLLYLDVVSSTFSYLSDGSYDVS